MWTMPLLQTGLPTTELLAKIRTINAQKRLVLSCNIPNVSEIDQSCVNDGAFSHLWQHIVLQNMYVDRSGYRFVKIGTLDKDLVLVPRQQLYTFMAFCQWLETKPHHKQLIL